MPQTEPPVIAWKPLRRTPDAASARLRTFLPCRYLKEAGWRCEIFEPRNIASYELVVFQKAYDEESIHLAETLSSRGVKTVFDLSDNHFYIPADFPVFHERAERLRRMIRAVDAVSVPTPELKKLVEHDECVVIDDAIEEPPKSAPLSIFSGLRECLTNISPARRLRVVWYGNAGSELPPHGLRDLSRVIPHLEALNAQIPLELTVISNSEELFRKYLGEVHFPAKYFGWALDTFAAAFRRQDVCVLPVSSNPFTVCKSNNRLVHSLNMGVPVVADEIPSYTEFRDFVFFADWQNSLRRYAADATLRRQHVQSAQRYIRSKYNKQCVVSQWSALFERMLGKRGLDDAIKSTPGVL